MINLDMDDREYSEWEDIIDTIDKTNFPIRFVKRVSFESTPESKYSFKKSIDIQHLRDEGYDDESIQEIISDTLINFPDKEGEMEFDLDIPKIAFESQLQTELILKNLQ